MFLFGIWLDALLALEGPTSCKALGFTRCRTAKTAARSSLVWRIGKPLYGQTRDGSTRLRCFIYCAYKIRFGGGPRVGMVLGGLLGGCFVSPRSRARAITYLYIYI